MYIFLYFVFCIFFLDFLWVKKNVTIISEICRTYKFIIHDINIKKIYFWCFWNVGQVLIDFIYCLLNQKIHANIYTKLVFLILWYLKNAKSCHVFFLIYGNMIVFKIYERLIHMQIEITLYFWKKDFFWFLWREIYLFNTKKNTLHGVHNSKLNTRW